LSQECQKDDLKADRFLEQALPRQDTVSPFLEIVNLKKDFLVNGSLVPAFSEVSFSADAGEMVCILGRSGCGKTTLLNIVAGFIKPSAGTVRVQGKAVRGPGPDRCVVFQEDALFPWLTVRENIAFGFRACRQGKQHAAEEVDRFLSLTGLIAFQNYLPKEISGGMKQRVALARVLILRPAVLLMDEPFASLDMQTREVMQDLLVTLWAELNQTVLFVTHDVDEAVKLADRILFMKQGSCSICEDIPVPMARPRKRENTEFVFFRRNLRELLLNR
jgi:NitT/TauT family transport system ATP-binding protein